MTEREPKDYHLGRRAYEAFYDEQPQVWFENLSHDYQMRWVRVARAVQEDARAYRNRGPVKTQMPTTDKGDIAEYMQILAEAPRRSDGKIDYRAISNNEARNRVRQAYRYLWIRKLLPKK